MIVEATINHAHLYCGIGGGAKGFNKGKAKVGNVQAKFVCIGGIDVDEAACRDFTSQVGTPATPMDLFSREQYLAFHGKEPPREWREKTPDDIRRAFQNKHPHVMFLSAPCKGFSGLLSEKMSATSKYQALNGLTLRGIWLALEAYKDDPVELFVFENVPRIATRGRFLLDQIVALFRAYNFAIAETTHDCGELGWLGQSRKRFLLVARYIPKVPCFLYEPVKHPLRGVGEILDRLPIPGIVPGLGGPMHRMPALQWKTWVRLAFVRAGADWRSLNELRVADGKLLDFGIMPERYGHRGTLGVKQWTDTSGTVTGRAHATRGAFNVADPRVDGHFKSVQLGVRPWDRPAGVVTGKMIAGGGPNSVADPRIEGKRFNSAYRIVTWDNPSPAIAGPGGPGGGLAVADPRSTTEYAGKGKYRVTGYGEPTGTGIGASTTGQGAFALADPRFQNWHPGASSAKLRVTEWDQPGGTVTGSQQVASGALSVADPRTGFGQHTHHHVLKVTPWDKAGGTVTASPAALSPSPTRGLNS